MRKIIILSTILILVSCSNPMDKKFNPDNYGSDLKEIQEVISKEEKNLLNSFLLKQSIGKKSLELNRLTYNELLVKAKKIKEEKERKLQIFYNTKFVNIDVFGKDTNKLIREGVFKVSSEEGNCIGFYCGYKKKEGNELLKMTYKQIIDAASSFCKEKNV